MPNQPDTLQRSVLPIPQRAYAGPITYGAINWIQLDQGADDQDHLISPEERLCIAMARQ